MRIEKTKTSDYGEDTLSIISHSPTESFLLGVLFEKLRNSNYDIVTSHTNDSTEIFLPLKKIKNRIRLNQDQIEELVIAYNKEKPTKLLYDESRIVIIPTDLTFAKLRIWYEATGDEAKGNIDWIIGHTGIQYLQKS